MAIHLPVHRGRGDCYRSVSGTLTLVGPFVDGEEVEFQVDHSAMTVVGDDTCYAHFNGPTDIAIPSTPGFIFIVGVDGTTGEVWRGLCRYVAEEVVIGSGVEYPASSEQIEFTWTRRGSLL